VRPHLHGFTRGFCSALAAEIFILNDWVFGGPAAHCRGKVRLDALSVIRFGKFKRVVA